MSLWKRVEFKCIIIIIHLLFHIGLWSPDTQIALRRFRVPGPSPYLNPASVWELECNNDHVSWHSAGYLICTDSIPPPPSNPTSGKSRLAGKRHIHPLICGAVSRVVHCWASWGNWVGWESEKLDSVYLEINLQHSEISVWRGLNTLVKTEWWF